MIFQGGGVRTPCPPSRSAHAIPICTISLFCITSYLLADVTPPNVETSWNLGRLRINYQDKKQRSSTLIHKQKRSHIYQFKSPTDINCTHANSLSQPLPLGLATCPTSTVLANLLFFARFRPCILSEVCGKWKSAQSRKSSFTFREVSALERLRVWAFTACICACKSLRCFRTFFEEKNQQTTKSLNNYPAWGFIHVPTWSVYEIFSHL